MEYNWSSWQDYDDKMYVENWENATRFVLIQAWKVPDEIPDEQVYEIFLGRKKNDKVKYFTFCYYIIDKKENHIYGPMTMNQYAQTRDFLAVPDDVRMKVKLKL
ncbi:MAG: hypothetical protein PHD21_00195 [Flavobacteriales bacterium]|nr:hypothetical protein [Flavobacteriales bacterium]